MIRVEGLSYRFRGSDRYALRNASLEIKPGEFAVITGPSGCGKSTLALAIGGYLFRQFDGEAEGAVHVDGIDVRNSPIYDVADVVGLVQQNPEAQFCTLTVGDEVAFGLENRRLPCQEIRERMAWALGIAGAQDLADRTLGTLSGGEKQKVAIAAMMATQPQVLIFDEPTSNLDPTATAAIFQVIEQIREQAGITVLVIEHKVDCLRRFEPRLIAMEGGRIRYDGAMEAAGPDDSVETSAGDRYGRPPDAPLVRVEDLAAGYDGHAVLRGLTAEVQPGELVAVMGDNGSGKTTFLHCLLGLCRPMRGRVEVLGHDTRKAPVSQIARQVGFVFQNPDHQLFADSVWDEATFAARNLGLLDGATEARVRDLMARCGLAERHDDHPYRLSYGEKRRLNLISVLGYAPRLILLDEVLIGQDPANAAFLLGLLREQVAGGGAVVMVNHAPGVTRRYADRLLFFENGRILVDAPAGEGLGRLEQMGRDAYVV
jgi:energy-coupling factor transporter ATP-binding protein EcfA2